jgi:iron complex transport system ATP-binding protein
MVAEKIKYRMAGLANIIEVKRLSFAYGDHKVFSDVSLSIPGNQFTVFMGQNGSGKSTLLRLMAGLIPYNTGSVLINGQELRDLRPDKRAGSIGFLAQKHRAVFPFTVEEVVLTGRAARVAYIPTRKDIQVTREAIEMAGIEHLKDRLYTELSGGEQQLVMIARTLAQQPEIILFDEPVSHLDYNNQIKIMGLIRQLINQGLTIVAVLHDPNLAFHFGDRFVYIHNRNVYEVKEGKPWEHKLVRDVFHEDIEIITYKGKCVFVP